MGRHPKAHQKTKNERPEQKQNSSDKLHWFPANQPNQPLAAFAEID
jgi:hypothetical protein